MTFSPRTWVVGETVSAAIMNQEIRDQFNSMFDAWTAYTPVWSAVTTDPVLGNGTLAGRYLKVGKTCKVNLILTLGSTSTFGAGDLRLSLPFTGASIAGGCGVLTYQYSRTPSPNYVMGSGPLSSSATTTGTVWLANPGTIGDWNAWASGSPWTGAAGDILRAYGEYQTAA
ncbi:hypothetical protein [Streptomyces sp. H27-C3]|uniref:hypothetical protein n=1 Tax=Streptomyces sp. H27-C3 TaxID=3046305 RepID=UPI0024B9216F|nr:hypothetical protein [Streptomyces sp. H27-C3]MDJ0461548.1 hypothetical protein [Streptomyces sp. H27-C3]